MFFHVCKILSPWNFQEFKADTYHATHACKIYPPFAVSHRRKSSSFRPNLDLVLVISPNHNSQNAEKHTVFQSVHWRDHIAAHKTGFQYKKLSIQNTNYVTFKKLAQQLMKGVPNWLLQITTLDALQQNCQMRWKQSLVNLEGVLDNLPGEGRLIIIETPHPGSLRPQWATLLLYHTELVDQVILHSPPN